MSHATTMPLSTIINIYATISYNSTFWRNETSLN